MDYLELTLELEPKLPWSEIAVAELADLGFESFVETENGIQAYAPYSIGNASELFGQTSLADNPEVRVKLDAKKIAHQNWNAQWESDFHPVEIDDKLVILAPFHDSSVFATKRQIIIQPQMSFGTGHHQTTYLMCRYLMEIPQIAEKVLDMGTGTGVLAILAEQLGAKEIVAVDIEPWSVENTADNALRNGCNFISAVAGDIDEVADADFGLILANINKNVLKRHLPYYYNKLKSGGTLLLSGFFESDIAEMKEAATSAGFVFSSSETKETWAAIAFTK